LPKQLNLQFSETLPGDIWQTSLSNNKLLIGCREEGGMNTTFSLYDLEKNAFQWKAISFEESWWISIYSFVESTIIFQVFNDSQNIESRTLFGFDIVKLEAIWSIEEVIAIGLSGDILKLKMNNEEESVFLIDINSGEQVESDDTEKLSESRSASMVLPFHYAEESPYFQTVKHFLKEFASLDLVGACDYLEHNNLIIISAHQKVEQNLSNALYVFNSSGNLLMTEILAAHSKGLASDTFYIVNEELIFVKEKREIKGYLI
jgi:hypothetical protein